MNIDYNVDEILTLLNDVTISEDELSDAELNDNEKKKIRKQVMNKIQSKNLTRRRIASSIVAAALLVSITVSFAKKDALANIFSSISIIPGIGEVNGADTGIELKNSKTNKDVTLNNVYIDNNKVRISFTIKGRKNYTKSLYELKDDKGNKYELKYREFDTLDLENISNYKLEYDGPIKKSNVYTLSLMDNKVVFSLNGNDFKKIPETKDLYTLTNGSTTLNITSAKKVKDKLKIDYYVSEGLNNADMSTPFNLGSFKYEEESFKNGWPITKSTIECPYFTLSDRHGNTANAHNDSYTSYNESLFSLKKLKGNKLKLSIPAIDYFIHSDMGNKDFSLELNVPREGKELVNKEGEYKGFKYKIISIERLSDKSIAVEYEPINDPNSKIQITNMGFLAFGYDESGSEPNKKIVVSGDTIGDKFVFDEIFINYASVGPFETEINLSDIK